MLLAGKARPPVDAQGTTATDRIAAIFAEGETAVLFPLEAGEGIKDGAAGVNVKLVGLKLRDSRRIGLAQNLKGDRLEGDGHSRQRY